MIESLIIIDVQNDFCEGGALAVPKGEAIVPIINKLLPRYSLRVFTQDWHCVGHDSFASSHKGKSPYDTIDLSYGEQVLWPDHCVQGSHGAEFHKDLHSDASELIIRKGFRKNIDSYSAFLENDKQTETGLSGYLRNLGVGKIILAGLALDFCVRYSALDGRKQGFEVSVVENACRAIDLDGSHKEALQEMQQAGVEFIKA